MSPARGFLDALAVLLEHGAKLDVRRRNGETPAHGAAINGHVEMLRELKRLGCDIQAVSYEGKTPLDLARHEQAGSGRSFASGWPVISLSFSLPRSRSACAPAAYAIVPVSLPPPPCVCAPARGTPAFLVSHFPYPRARARVWW